MDESSYKVSNELLGQIRQSPRQATVEEVADLADDLLMARFEIARLRARESRSRRTLSVELQNALSDWKDAGAPVERVALAIGNLVQAGIDFVIAEFDDDDSPDSADGDE